MQYQEAVQEAQRLDRIIDEAEHAAEDAKWARAKLAWEQIQAGISRRQWARDTGKHKSTIVRWVQVWERWGGADRHQGYTFNEAYEIVKDSSLEEAAPGELYSQRRTEQAKTTVRNLPPAQKAEVVREALADPVVAEVAMRDDDTSVNVAAARAKHVQQRNERQDEAARIRAPELYEASDLAEVGNNLAHISSRLELLAQQLQKVPAAKRASFGRLWGEVKQHVGWVESVMIGDDIDEGFAKLLDGGDQR